MKLKINFSCHEGQLSKEQVFTIEHNLERESKIMELNVVVVGHNSKRGCRYQAIFTGKALCIDDYTSFLERVAEILESKLDVMHKCWKIEIA